MLTEISIILSVDVAQLNLIEKFRSYFQSKSKAYGLSQELYAFLCLR